MTTSAGTTDPPALQKVHGLKTNVLGLPALFAQSVAAISPTMTAVLIIPLAFASAGQGTGWPTRSAPSCCCSLCRASTSSLGG
jgi:hypothetical protein